MLIISTITDDTLESNEALVVLLETSDPDVNIGLNATTITIGNDDCKQHKTYAFIVRLSLLISSPVVTLSFEMEQYSSEEGDSVTVCVVLSGQTERDVAVRISTIDGSAQGCSSELFS